MILITLVAFAIHSIVVLRAVAFFFGGNDSRDTDKAIIAGIGVLSALFVASQVYTVLTDPNAVFLARVTLRTGYDAAAAFIFFCVVHNTTEARDRRGEHRRQAK